MIHPAQKPSASSVFIARSSRGWRTRLPFFYGWLVVAAAFTSLGVTYVPYHGFSVFYVAILDDTGWSHGASASVFSLFVLVAGLGGIAAGALVDRFGPARVVAGGVLLEVSGLAASSRATELWHLYLSFGIVVALGVGATGWVPCVTMVSRWFSSRLGAALGIASAGVGAGIVTMVPFSQWLISIMGWRSTYLVLAGIMLVVVVPTAVVVMRSSPEELGLRRDGAKATEDGRTPSRPVAPAATRRIVDPVWANRDWTVGSAVRTRRFWALLAMVSTNNVAIQMIFIHQAAFLVDGGYDRMLAASVVGAVGLISIVGKTGWGWVSDRLGRERAWTLGLSLIIPAMMLLFSSRQSGSLVLAYLYALVYAAAYSASPPLMPTVAGDLFAGRTFGSIYGLIGAVGATGTSVGVWLAGYTFDLTGSYNFAFTFATIATLTSAALIWAVAPGKVRAVPGR